MTFYQLKPVIHRFEAITFDQLVEHGKAIYKRDGLQLPDKNPRYFDYKGHSVAKESDDCYLFIIHGAVIKFNRGQIIVSDDHGVFRIISPEDFNALFDRVEEPNAEITGPSGSGASTCSTASEINL